MGLFAQILITDFTHAIMAKHAAMNMTQEEATQFEQETTDVLEDPSIHAQTGDSAAATSAESEEYRVA